MQPNGNHRLAFMNETTAANKGFTLVELAVSLVVIGLLIGLGTSMVGPLMTAIKVRESKENLGAAVESINSWASGNNRLPKADDTTPDTTIDEFSEVSRSPKDAWGRNFIYLYDDNLFKTTPTKDTICGRRTTPIELTDNNTGAIIKNIAYVISSQGEDPQTTVSNTYVTLDGSAVTASALLATPPNPRAIVVPANTDDLVRWVTLDELRTKAGCQGAQLRIVNNELPFTYETQPYEARFFVDGGVPSYSWCATGTLPGGIKLYTKTTATQVEIALSPTECSLTAGTWVVQDTNEKPALYGTPTAAPTTRGTYQINLYVKDSNTNLAQKTFVLTVNP